MSVYAQIMYQQKEKILPFKLNIEYHMIVKKEILDNQCDHRLHAQDNLKNTVLFSAIPTVFTLLLIYSLNIVRDFARK